MQERRPRQPAAKPVEVQDMETKGQGDPLRDAVSAVDGRKPEITDEALVFVLPQGGEHHQKDEEALLTDVGESIPAPISDEERQRQSQPHRV